jgi:thiamine-phosphate pyrophosphorylase
MLMGKNKLTRGLYLILTDPKDGYEALTRLAVEAKLPALQLRYKGNDKAYLHLIAEKMRALTLGSKTRFIVNDHPEIAAAVQADGVHVGQDDLPPEKVRNIVGSKMLIGLSTHNLVQVQKANLEPVDYIGFGPLFDTTSKANPDPVVGLQMLLNASKISSAPIVAIGGITLNRIKTMDLSTCLNVAVISAVCQATNPFNAMQTLNKIIQEYQIYAP